MAKDYSAGGAKKWLIIVGVIVLVAILIVAIVLMIPANTYSMIGSLKESEQTYFLKDDDERASYSKFVSKINSNNQTSYYYQEVKDIQSLSNSMSIVLGYYNDFIVFAKNNSVMSKNYKKIKNNITKAEKYQKNMDKIINNASNYESSSYTLIQNAMIDFRKEFESYMECYQNAIISLNNVYQGCFDVSYSNNTASKNILNAVNDYIYSIVNDYKVLVSSDRKGSSTSSYSYKSRYKISYFGNFVDDFLTNTNDIRNYMFNSSLQTKYEKIERFFTLYGEKDFKQLIATINNSGVQKTYTGIVDEDSVYSTVKNFLA